MERTELQYAFLSLVRLGIGVHITSSIPITEKIDWIAMEAIAMEQGLLGVLVDGIENLPENQRPPKDVLMRWIGFLMQGEARNAVQQKKATDMALLFHDNGIRTYVLKGDVVAECYPRPEHRVSSDLDCYLLPNKGDFDAWELGNELIK